MACKKLIKKKSKNKIKSSVEKRIPELFQIANENYPDLIYKKNLKLMETYSKKYKVSIPREIKRKYCKKCYEILKFGKTATIRFKPKQKIKVITCNNCGNIKRIGFKKQTKG